ncbi:MAG TPA: sensor histidine kinase [Archangium sp.]|uniref:sensor histidine kinase n=1 Tax=Archangium sp. TaxID=1872627 RepID=UPI002E33C6A6|nr:sensor histidine kinase [Archangium sp.]HEX5748834.1 sensor histidine kinase [Archangium sp.]
MDPPMHAAMRSPLLASGLLLLAGLVAASPLVPGLGPLLGVRLGDTGPVMLLFMTVSLGATLAFHGAGRHAWTYRLLNWLETAVWVGGELYLVWASGNASSPFWVLYFALVFHTAGTGSARLYNTVLLAGGPTVLGAAFWVARKDAGAAAVCVGTGAMGGLVYVTLSRAAAQLRDMVAERERLQARVAELLVHEERARIARDLHDGVGSELSALLWSVRTLEARLGEGGRAEELSGFAERIRQGTDELRSVVWALRAESQDWESLVAHLRGRCLELCGEQVVLRFFDEGAPAGTVLPGEARLQVVRIVQEAVRNAVRHAHPRTVTVRLSGHEELRVVVEDDGCGLPEGALERSSGGLRNLRHRAMALGGTLRFSTSPQGTRMEAILPGARRP